MLSRISLPQRLARYSARRLYATVEAPVIVAKPPLPPLEPPKPSHNPIDSFLLSQLASTPSSSRASLPQLIQQYLDKSSHVLDAHLPYEPRPSHDRRVSFESADTVVHLIAHVVKEGERSKITLSSGFAIEGAGDHEGRTVIITCAHTLEEIRWSPLLVLPNWSSPSSPHLSLPDLPHARSSGSFLVTQGSTTSQSPTDTSALTARSITAILSSLHRSDLVALAFPTQSQPIRTLPVSPYPAHPDTRVRAHFVSETRPHGHQGDGWKPWPGGWSKWVSGRVLGYRDFAGREAQPGTYDALSHMLFEPPPTAGSSGGPIVDEDTGAVVGVMLGSRMDNRVEGLRGWGVPSETIFEMFSLPGLKVNDRK